MRNLLLTVIGLVIIAPPLVHAQDQPIADHYLEPVFQRIQAGVDASSTGTVYPDTTFVFFQNLARIVSSLLEFMDTEVQVTEYERNLATVSPCLHHDLLLFEERIADVREDLRKAFRERRLFDVWRLQHVMRFANIRYRHFVEGAHDPNYNDDSFHEKHFFDAQRWCCEGADQSSVCTLKNRDECGDDGVFFGTHAECARHCRPQNPVPIDPDVCPFDMRYLPPSENGYGCTVSVLRGIDNPHESVQEEIDAIVALDQALRDASDDDRPPLVQPNQPSGCMDLDAWPDGAIAFARRGPFSVDPNDPRMIQDLYDVLAERGLEREPPDYAKVPEDYPPNERQQAEQRERGFDYFHRAWRFAVRSYYSIWNREHSLYDARIITQSVRQTTEIDDALEPMRQNMKEFAELASKLDRGGRHFNNQLMFTLARSCPFRPCKKILERVMKINYTDSCFPYSDGSFANDPTHHVTCKEQAGVEEEL